MLYLPLVVEAACVGVVCGEGQTCEGGRCASASPSDRVDGGAIADAGGVAQDAGAGPDAAPVRDAGGGVDSAPPPPPPNTCPPNIDPGGICCGTTWCVGADCAALCGVCEALHCPSAICTENGGQKLKCAPPM